MRHDVQLILSCVHVPTINILSSSQLTRRRHDILNWVKKDVEVGLHCCCHPVLDLSVCCLPTLFLSSLLPHRHTSTPRHRSSPRTQLVLRFVALPSSFASHQSADKAVRSIVVVFLYISSFCRCCSSCQVNQQWRGFDANEWENSNEWCMRETCDSDGIVLMLGWVISAPDVATHPLKRFAYIKLVSKEIQDTSD